jgi:hypothetical protein
MYGGLATALSEPGVMTSEPEASSELVVTRFAVGSFGTVSP